MTCQYYIDKLSALLGEQLESVSFLWGYHGLGFQSISITIFSPVSFALADGSQLGSEDCRFKDLLCEHLGATVSAVEIDEMRLKIGFAGGTSVWISTDPRDDPNEDYYIILDRRPLPPSTPTDAS